jgi:hypothetical protein
MALQLGKFGIKEVADVKFYNVGDVKFDAATGTVSLKDSNVKEVLSFDTLKVSSLEFTGETAEARGGKGNSVLISWDHSREATLTLEDALLSVESLNTMLSSQGVKENGNSAVISIDANGFPGTYTVVGKTYARGQDGVDNILTFLIFKAKVQAEASFEMTADGDPSTLNMTLKVLRCADGEKGMGCVSGDLMKLIIDDNQGTTTPQPNWPGYTA